MNASTSNSAPTRWVLVLTAVGSLMAALDTLVVSTALPTIRLHLQASIGQLEWTVNAYNLSFAVLLITAAGLGDRYGRRNLYATGLGLFAAASAVCALAPNVGWLIGARTVQGAGAALIASLGLALLSAAFPPERRGAAIGIFSAIVGLAVASGPLVGGAVVEGLNWEWIFWINVPIGLIAIPFVLTRMRESRGPDTSLDIRGLALVTLGALGVVWGLVRGNQAGWGSAEVVASLALGALLIAAFAAWELRAPAPMLPMRFFRSRAFSAGNAAIFFTFVGSVAPDAIGKAAGVNSMMRELGGVFGIAVIVAVFAGAGGYASAHAFIAGFAPAIGVAAGFALAGALAGLALPGRRRVTAIARITTIPAFEAEDAR